MTPLTPNGTSDHATPASTDGHPRYFLDDSFDSATDGDWWLDLGCVNLPVGIRDRSPAKPDEAGATWVPAV